MDKHHPEGKACEDETMMVGQSSLMPRLARASWYQNHDIIIAGKGCCESHETITAQKFWLSSPRW